MGCLALAGDDSNFLRSTLSARLLAQIRAIAAGLAENLALVVGRRSELRLAIHAPFGLRNATKVAPHGAAMTVPTNVKSVARPDALAAPTATQRVFAMTKHASHVTTAWRPILLVFWPSSTAEMMPECQG